MVVIVMGVSGCGKSTVGALLAKRLGIPFYDADDFHPPENVEKMESGEPLSDIDRHPWLERLSREIESWSQTGGAVLACSALKESYRQVLSANDASRVRFIWLHGPEELISERLQKRKWHYMPPDLLRSQFEALEPPENATAVSVDQPPEEIVEKLIKWGGFVEKDGG